MELREGGPLSVDFDLPADATSVGRLEAGKLRAFDTIVRPCSRRLVPAVVRVELNADTDRDVLIRMCHLAHKKRKRHPEITDEEMADYLALAENCPNFEHWLKLRRAATRPRASSGTLLWLVGILAIIGLLSTGLIASIAVLVSGLRLTG